jgi:hypothetical protein
MLRAATQQQVCTAEGVNCEWCGAATTDGNHGSTAECVEALRQEVSALRALLRERESAREATPRKADLGSRRTRRTG